MSRGGETVEIAILGKDHSAFAACNIRDDQITAFGAKGIVMDVGCVVAALPKPRNEARRQIFVDDESHSAATGGASTREAANSKQARISASERYG